MRRRTQIFAAIALFTLGGCATVDVADNLPSDGAATEYSDNQVLIPGRVIEDNWQRLNIDGEVEVTLEVVDQKMMVKLSPHHGAGGIYRRFEFDPNVCANLRWSWIVPRQRNQIDLTAKSGDDVDAAIFVLFGDPGFAFAPRPVQTIRYVATSSDYAIGSVVPNPYAPDIVKSIVVSNRQNHYMELVHFERDVAEDYRQAFGSDQVPTVKFVALFADSDQTADDIESYFLGAHVKCA